MNIIDLINETISEVLGDIWYHGTPDVRDLEKEGGFTEKTIGVQYINDIDGYNELMNRMQNAHKTDQKLYFKLLDEVDKYKSYYRYNKPVFLTDVYSVAKTYADPKRAYDYQKAEEKVLEVKVHPSKILTINAFGDRFRFISLDQVRQGFINSGVNANDFDNTIKKFNFYLRDKSGITTDMIGALANWYGFDTVDVKGVLDSYNGGNVKSTVRMVMNPKDIEIVKK